MKCNQCGKDIPQTNQHNINYNGVHMIVCGKHYNQYLKYGKFLDDNPKSCQDSNEYEIIGDKVWIYCFNKHNEPSGKFLIDKEDLGKVMAHKWRFWKGRFFTGNSHPIPIHNFLLNPRKGFVVDHIDNNPANNCKNNLRITTQQNNCLNKTLNKNNSSGVAGVTWDKNRKKWAVEIRMSGIRCHLTRWDKLEDAVYARYIAETILFKEFRSTANDDIILPYVIDCNNKDLIKKYVEEQLQSKFKDLISQ